MHFFLLYSLIRRLSVVTSPGSYYFFLWFTLKWANRVLLCYFPQGKLPPFRTLFFEPTHHLHWATSGIQQKKKKKNLEAYEHMPNMPPSTPYHRTHELKKNWRHLETALLTNNLHSTPREGAQHEWGLPVGVRLRVCSCEFLFLSWQWVSDVTNFCFWWFSIAKFSCKHADRENNFLWFCEP